MINTLIGKVFGTKNEREIKRLMPKVADINALEPAMEALSDDALRAKTAEFRERLAKGETLDDVLVDAFAVVREAGPIVTALIIAVIVATISADECAAILDAPRDRYLVARGALRSAYLLHLPYDQEIARVAICITGRICPVTASRCLYDL